MIVDTSALLAILFQEEDAEWFVDALVAAPARRMSAANFLEATPFGHNRERLRVTSFKESADSG